MDRRIIKSKQALKQALQKLIQVDEFRHLTIEEIFDSNRFYEIKAVTFSAEESFLNKYLTPFRSVDLIIGIQDTDVQARGIMALKNETRNLIESQKRIIKKEQIKFFENLSRENQENFVKEK